MKKSNTLYCIDIELIILTQCYNNTKYNSNNNTQINFVMGNKVRGYGPHKLGIFKEHPQKTVNKELLHDKYS